MPLRTPSIQRSVPSKPFVCLNCRQRQIPFSSNGQSSRRQIRPKPIVGWTSSRAASTTPSVTAVNAKRKIPSTFQTLYTSLKELEQKAGIYVNTSQLQLALNGLESENPVTRIAVLGLNGQTGARRLTRALLADPLVTEAEWEKQLIKANESDARAIVLRYNEHFTIDDRHPLVRTISIPSSVLEKHKLEILIHNIDSMTDSANEGAANLLVPGLEIANSVGGRRSMVTYPVHRVLLYEEGLNSLRAFATIEKHSRKHPNDQMFKGVVDWSWSTSQQRNKDEQPVSPINLALGEAAIETFRQSLDKSLDYEHLWFDAGMPALSAWLLEGSEVQAGLLKPAVKALIQTIHDGTRQGLVGEEALRVQQEIAATVPIVTKNIINQGITIWAENAHTELRDRLNTAFQSKDWKKTKWWKLFWRVDDVGYIASNILQRTWLIDAEKEMIWISGRIHQSGLLGPLRLRPSAAVETEKQKLGGMPPAPSAAELIPDPSSFNEPLAVQQPWPQDVSRARAALTSLSVPPLQALSQALVLQTISTNILTSSFSVFLYFSISTTSLYESGAIAAAGLVFSLRWLQRRWEATRNLWESEVREEGRRVLRKTEGLAREAVEGVKPEIDEVGLRERMMAKETAIRVKVALDEISG